MSTSNTTTPPSSEEINNPKGTQTSTLASLLPKTYGVQNIEAAYVRGGASKHHTPGHAKAETHQGVGSEKFTQKFADQRIEPSLVGKMFNNIINGTDHTK